MARLGASLEDNQSVGIAPDVKDEFEKIIFTVNSPTLSSGSTDCYIFVAPVDCTVLSVKECHVTKGSSGSVMLEKCSSTGAIGSTGNTDLLKTAINLAATAHTVQTATLSTSSSALSLDSGDRIALDFLSTGHASLAGGVITIKLRQDA